MKLKVGELKIIGEGLSEILMKELPAKPSYWLARIANKLDSEFRAFERARIKLVIKHTKKDENGEPMFLKNKEGNPTRDYDVADIEAFNKEYEEIAEQEVEIDFRTIKLDDLLIEKCDKCGKEKLIIKPIILAKLEKIIEL